MVLPCLPGTQSLHSPLEFAATSAEYLPARQSRHVSLELAPKSDEYFPATQSLHKVSLSAATVVEYLPILQFKQRSLEFEAASELYLPAITLKRDEIHTFFTNQTLCHHTDKHLQTNTSKDILTNPLTNRNLPSSPRTSRSCWPPAPQSTCRLRSPDTCRWSWRRPPPSTCPSGSPRMWSRYSPPPPTSTSLRSAVTGQDGMESLQALMIMC